MESTSYSNAFSGCCGFQIHDVEPLCLSTKAYDDGEFSEGDCVGRRAVVTAGVLHLWKTKAQWFFLAVCLDDSFNEILAKGKISDTIYPFAVQILDAIQRNPSILHRAPAGYQMFEAERSWFKNNMECILSAVCLKKIWEWYMYSSYLNNPEIGEQKKLEFEEFYRLLRRYQSVSPESRETSLKDMQDEVTKRGSLRKSELFLPRLKESMTFVTILLNRLFQGDKGLVEFNDFASEKLARPLLGPHGLFPYDIYIGITLTIEAIPVIDFNLERHVVERIPTFLSELLSVSKQNQDPCYVYPFENFRSGKESKSPVSVADYKNIFFSESGAHKSDSEESCPDDNGRPKSAALSPGLSEGSLSSSDSDRGGRVDVCCQCIMS